MNKWLDALDDLAPVIMAALGVMAFVLVFLAACLMLRGA